jgi:hypothetical protein
MRFGSLKKERISSHISPQAPEAASNTHILVLVLCTIGDKYGKFTSDQMHKEALTETQP